MMHIYCFKEGHDIMLEFLNAAMCEFDTHEDYAPKNDVYSWEWLKDGIVIPSNVVAEMIA